MNSRRDDADAPRPEDEAGTEDDPMTAEERAYGRERAELQIETGLDDMMKGS